MAGWGWAQDLTSPRSPDDTVGRLPLPAAVTLTTPTGGYPPHMSAALEWASTFRERMRTVVPIALSSEMPPG